MHRRLSPRGRGGEGGGKKKSTHRQSLKSSLSLTIGRRRGKKKRKSMTRPISAGQKRKEGETKGRGEKKGSWPGNIAPPKKERGKRKK